MSRGVEEAVEVGVEKMLVEQLRYRASIEDQLIRSKNRSSIDPLGVEKLSKRHELSRSIHQVLRSCQDCDMKKLEKLDR